MRRIWWAMLVVGAFFYGLLYAFFPPAFIPPLAIPLIILVALVIWALPAKERAVPINTMRWLFMGFTIALIGWPNYLAIALPGLPWITLTRVFLFPLTLIFLSSLSLSLSARRELMQVLAQNHLVVRLLLLFVVIQVLSLPFSSTPFDSFEKFFMNQLYWTAIFILACYLFRDPKLIVSWAWLLIGLAVWVSALAFWEWRLGRLPWAGHIPSFLQIDDPSIARTLAGSSRAGAVDRRVEGTFPVSLGLGEYLALISPLLFYFTLEAPRFWMRAIAAVVIPFVFFTIVNTGARVGSIGFVLALVLYGAFWAIRRWQIDRRSFIGPALALSYPFVACIFLAATFIFGRLRAMVWGGSNTQASNEARMAQFHTGWPKVFEAPLGHGAGRGADVLGYTNGEGILTIDTYTLRLALEYGLFGLVVFYLLFILPTLSGVRIGLRSSKEYQIIPPLCVSLVVFLLIKTVYSSEFIHSVPFAMAGAICAMIARSRADLSQRLR
jgi:hypothetical protein